jgi:ankyrin repeat protein
MSAFESAADAIINGDAATLRRLLSEDPQLVRARSEREHHATLLHYCAANGVEESRQKTPGNIVEIAEILLDAGADVNAETDAYKGRWTTLGLAATSCHPEAAGVQIPLLALLIDRGAVIDRPVGIVVPCLHNGTGEAADFLASRGAALDAEGAAGVGRVDLLKTLPATEQQLRDGFAWACEYGKADVVGYLLESGISLEAQQGGPATGLHWAAYAGDASLVRLLLAHGAATEVREGRFDGTPLDWALYGRRNPPKGTPPERYEEVIEALTRASSAQG